MMKREKPVLKLSTIIPIFHRKDHVEDHRDDNRHDHQQDPNEELKQEIIRDILTVVSDGQTLKGK
jgi:hypothetical protein